MMPTPQAYIAHGWDECLRVLGCWTRRSPAWIERQTRVVTGEGWIAEKPLPPALCF
jgi:hypothetical protein